jgi:hypothetical protein
LTWRESNYFEKKEKKLTSPPSAVQRETIIDSIDLVDPIAPVDVPIDMVVVPKRPACDRQNL